MPAPLAALPDDPYVFTSTTTLDITGVGLPPCNGSPANAFERSNGALIL